MNESGETENFILVPRAYDPSGLRQESRALGATISGMRHRCRCAVSRITRIRLFPLFFHNGCSQSSRFLPQARRIVGSGVENEKTFFTFSRMRRQKSPLFRIGTSLNILVTQNSKTFVHVPCYPETMPMSRIVKKTCSIFKAKRSTKLKTGQQTFV